MLPISSPEPNLMDFEPISTGSLRLDLALHTGGILPGEVVEIAGAPESGKTCLCLHLAAAANWLGRPCIWLDGDALLDPAWALRLGVDPQQMLVIPPLKAEAALDVLARLAGCGAPLLIVIDSINSLLSTEETPPYAGQSGALQPPPERLLSLTLRRLVPQLQRGRISLVYTRRSLPSGPAYHQLASHLARLAPALHTEVRLLLGNPSPINDGRRIVGQRVAVRVQRLAARYSPSLAIRRKFPPCSAEIELDIMYNQGIIRVGEVFDLGLALGLIHFRKGAFTVGNRDLGPDRAAAGAALERLGLAAPMEQVIRHKLLRNDRLD